MPRTAPVILSIALYCLSAFAAEAARAQSVPNIPDYFFREWSVGSDCSEQHAGPAGHVKAGLKFRIGKTPVTADGQKYAVQTVSVDGAQLAGDWSRLQLEYRAGTKMATLPADFECSPDQSSTSPFLAMSSYSQSAEPWYEYEHWYGQVDIHGEPHHVLIFPRDFKGRISAVILLQDVNAADNVTLDHNGVIHSDN